MSSNSGYIGIAIIGGVIAALIAGGMYYASGDTMLTPTSMRSYGEVSKGDFTPHFGGRKTNKRKKNGRKSRKL